MNRFCTNCKMEFFSCVEKKSSWKFFLSIVGSTLTRNQSKQWKHCYFKICNPNFNLSHNLIIKYISQTQIKCLIVSLYVTYKFMWVQLILNYGLRTYINRRGIMMSSQIRYYLVYHELSYLITRFIRSPWLSSFRNRPIHDLDQYDTKGGQLGINWSEIDQSIITQERGRFFDNFRPKISTKTFSH